jgi:two-component system, chemotaxis family, sensor kinase CheA
VGWNNDPELQELFKTELDERVERLLEGAKAMQEGAVTPESAGAMLREGHTIKGTGRVMGFEAISRAGQALEQLWRRIQHGDLTGTAELGVAIEELAAVLPSAVTADPEDGTPQLTAALGRLAREVAAAEAPQAPADPGPPEAVEEAPPKEGSSDLGGLLGALQTWASEEVIPVNAGRLYQLLNKVAALRIDTAAGSEVGAMITATPGEPVDGRVDVLVKMMTGIHRDATALEAEALELASAPVSEVTNTLPQLVRYLAKKTGKEIRFEVVGDELAVDRQVLERIADPIRQLVVNAIEHGVEPPDERESKGKPSTATIAVRGTIKDHQLEIAVEDDGRGIDWGEVRRAAVRKGLVGAEGDPEEEFLRSLLFAPGFSTATAPSELVGDGIGLTNVSDAIEALYGSLRLETDLAQGTRVVLTVPVSRALQRAVLVEAAGQKWGIPEAAVDEIVPMSEVELVAGKNRSQLVWRDRRIPAASFAAAVGLTESSEPTRAIILASHVGQVAVTVTSSLGSREVAAKELGPLLAGPAHLTGAALLGGGDVVLLVDSARLAERVRALPSTTGPAPRILVVDDSQGARQVVAGALATAGFATTVAGSVEEALEALDGLRPDALVVDFSMPEADGVSLVEQVRERFGALPVVMLSGVATPEDQARARRAGADAYYNKADFREGALAETLRKLVDSRATLVEVDR